MAKYKQNYLDFIPEKNPAYPVSERDNGLVTVTIRHKGFYSRIAQAFFDTPDHSDIDFDKYGSFIWNQIDGTHTLYDIGKLAEAKFGGDVSPLYPRLVKFFAILKEYRFIVWKRLVS